MVSDSADSYFTRSQELQREMTLPEMMTLVATLDPP